MSAAVSQLLGPAGHPLTREQAVAVRRRSGALLLAANAGSGKTSVLVERFARTVLEDGIAPDRILAITFTEKAAGELRDRVRRRLLRDRERELAARVESAWISTIHAACLRILRAHAAAAGLDPDFAILDEATSRRLRADAWRTALTRVCADLGDTAIDVVAAYHVDLAGEEVMRVHDELRSAGETRPSLPPPPEAGIPDPGRLQRARAAVADELAAAAETKSVAEARAALARCEEVLVRGFGEDGPAPGVLDGLTFSKRGRALTTDVCTAYRDALAAYAGAWRDRRAVEVVRVFDALLGAFADAYAAAKRARAAVDFDDLELRCRDLLRDQPAIRARYAERFARIMVDEFQDSSPLQVEIFGLLGGGGEELVTVGDEFQSIYRFRHADVEVFRRRRAELAARDAVAVLSANFRSAPEILEAVNAVFLPRFGETFAPLRPGRERPRADEPVIELLLTDAPAWEDETTGPDLGALPGDKRWRHAEARLLAQRVADLVAEGEPPEDIVVLVRALTDLPAYERALEEQGLSVLASGGRGYWGRQVVRDLCGWLTALANPRDEPSLYGVLASPLVGLSPDGLLRVARAGRGRVWDAISRGEVDAGLSDDDRDRLRRFAARFAHERSLAGRLAIDELLRRVIEASDYDLHVLRLPGGQRRLANVHKLLRLATVMEGAGADLRAFVDHATAELEANAREGDAPVELAGSRAVRLMTVHAAKGLEFGVVCVADMGRELQSRTGALLVADGRVGLRLRTFDGVSEPALAHDEIKTEIRAAERAEEERIAYVALTRAERRLILSGGVDVGDWPDPDKANASMLGWLGPALLPGITGALADDDPIRDLPIAGDDPARPRVRCALHRPATVGRVLRPQSAAPAGRELPTAHPPGVRAPEAAAVPAAPIPARLSFTQLADHRACGYGYYLRRILRLPQERPPDAPRLGDEGTGVESRLRGSIAHRLLEDLDPARPGIWGRGGDVAGRTLLVRAVAEGWDEELSEEDAAEIAGLVAGFADAPLAARLAQAEEVQREHAFAIPLGAEVLLTGVVDVLARERDGALVVDYKTNRLADDVDRDAYIDAHYAVQRDVYALAALRGGAQRATVVYVLLDRPAEPIVFDVAAAEADALEARLLAVAGDVLAGRYEVTGAPHRVLCQTCPGLRGLCSHPREVLLRDG
jgi:ATP-dependent exoDNAse (exonuclease V) beta subunit